MQKKFTTWFMLAVAVVVVLVTFYWLDQGVSVQSNQNGEVTSTDQTAVTPSSASTASSQTTLSYAAALKLYEGKRIQFDEKCLLTPNYVTFKKGTTIMFDNRGSKAMVIKLDGTAYTIKAYGFMLVTLKTTATLPHSMMVDCGNGENNGTILLQQ